MRQRLGCGSVSARGERDQDGDLFRLLVGGVVDYAIVLLNPEGLVLSWNEGAHRTSGYRGDEILGKHFSVFYLPEDVARGEPEAALGEAAREGRFRGEGWRIRKDSSRFWANDVITSLMQDGEVAGFALVTRDLSERRRAEQERAELLRLEGEAGQAAARSTERIHALNAELEQHVADLEATSKELEAFSYSVSHDLRAPLRAVIGFARIVLEDHGAALTPEVLEYLQLIHENSEQMGHLIEDLLGFARLGRLPLKKRQVSLSEIARSALDDLLRDQPDRAIEATVGDLPDAMADRPLLRQVFTNLLSNALKYTRTRDVARIDIGCQLQDGEQAYFVRDNGVGFDMRYAPRLFGVFQRLHRAEEYEGTGVGLALVQRIVQRHGGRVWAEAEVGQGATFYFSLGMGKNSEHRIQHSECRSTPLRVTPLQ